MNQDSVNSVAGKLNALKGKKAEESVQDNYTGLNQDDIKSSIEYLRKNNIKINSSTKYDVDQYLLIERFKSNFGDATNESLILKGIEATLTDHKMNFEDLRPVSEMRLKKFIQKSIRTRNSKANKS